METILDNIIPFGLGAIAGSVITGGAIWVAGKMRRTPNNPTDGDPGTGHEAKKEKKS